MTKFGGLNRRMFAIAAKVASGRWAIGAGYWEEAEERAARRYLAEWKARAPNLALKLAVLRYREIGTADPKFRLVD